MLRDMNSAELTSQEIQDLELIYTSAVGCKDATTCKLLTQTDYENPKDREQLRGAIERFWR